MKGKVVVISGATSGIGEVAAQSLAAMGARIVLIARDAARGQKTLTRLRSLGSSAAHSIYYGDLSRISESKRVAAEISAAEPRLDVLINNAGALFGTRRLTADSLEETFATNHMAYFVLTLGLRASLIAGAPSRVVSTASAAHKGHTLDFDDLQATKGYSAIRAYGRSKLCNILFTRELAGRWKGTGVTANCLHPGFVATRFGDSSGGVLSGVVRVGKALFAITPEKGAKTLVYLASSPEVAAISGDYFYKCRIATPTAAAQDDDAAKRLWEESARIAGIETWKPESS
ncbi:MAG TPA: SDR family NAD(P)-dependent oxidoreductase [Steroidobacteraceae bacterium]|jgi:NAD(P)-dependent dehydrogenase (short-subunit alcohol dehydrogenase family)|nr:SDR family NAD(P)-dependent oxidoreductase [Steroidobacteraceae bacterium]